MADKIANGTEVQRSLDDQNEKYALSYTGQNLATAPQKHYCIVTCMDSRIAVFQAFGMELGDAHVIRNAGASARDALRSIIISQQYLGTREVVLIKHTRCGMALFTDSEAEQSLSQKLGEKAATAMKGKEWFSFKEIGLEQAVKDDVKFLEESGALVPGSAVSGWVFDVETGRVLRIA